MQDFLDLAVVFHRESVKALIRAFFCFISSADIDSQEKKR
jgi:hypothetical protein